MRARFLLFVMTLALLQGAARADLAQAKAQPNLEKRSRLALENAQQALKAARTAYDGGENDKAATLIAEVRESVELAEISLRETGKNPRRSPKYFKSAEIETRGLVRKIDAFRDAMSVTDRTMLDAVRAKVQQVHDDLLAGIMEGKHR